MSLKKYLIKNRGKENIEAEEIFLDAEAIQSIEEKGKLEQPIKSRNFIFLYGLVIFCFLILFFRAGYLQIVKGEYYKNLSQGNRLRVHSMTPPRGIIYDKDKDPLVYNTPSFDLVVSLTDFFDNPKDVQSGILEKIAQVSGQERNDLEEHLKKSQAQASQTILIKGMERETALILESLVNDWPGVRIDQNAKRHYLFGSYFSHILGYTGEVSQTDLINNPEYFLGKEIGKAGLESQYEDTLKGQPGQKQFEVDSLGKTIRLLANKEAQPGQGLILHLDKDLQQKVYQSLESAKKKAVAIAINPKNGGVMAMVSLPSFDNNIFAQGISQDEMEILEKDPGEPFLNRAVLGQYPSGSIIKPLIAAAALEEKIINPFQKINCQGGISIVNQYDPGIVYYFPDWKTHGWTDMIKAIAESCNVYFYTIGGGYNKIEGLGVERIKKYLEYFGLNNRTGIDLPHEEVGLVPGGEGEWRLGDTYHLAIGQGDILVTPIQMAMAISAIANGGILYQPQIVDKITDLNNEVIEDIPEKIIRENFIEKDYLEIIRQGMRQAVTDGSAASLADLPIKVAGKTGTAQFGNQGKTHAWFVGFAPADDPEIVVIILVEGGGEGHQAAVPVAKEILKWYFNQ